MESISEFLDTGLLNININTSNKYIQPQYLPSTTLLPYHRITKLYSYYDGTRTLFALFTIPRHRGLPRRIPCLHNLVDPNYADLCPHDTRPRVDHRGRGAVVRTAVADRYRQYGPEYAIVVVGRGP